MTEAVADPAATSTGADTSADGTKPGEGELAPSTTPDGEPKPDGAKPDAALDPKTAEADYEFKMPDGIELDKASTEEFKAIAKELKLPKDVAQRVVDVAVKREQAARELRDTTVKQWADDVKADKELGGDKLPETLAIAKKAIDIGPPELKTFLDASGLGNHPLFVKWAHTIGKALSEDRFVSGSKAPAEAGRSLEDRLYGNTK
jgi:hypothetical protein